MKILVVGVGVVGSVYAAKLVQAGHSVDVVARGQRAAELRASGVRLKRAGADHVEVIPVPVVDLPAAHPGYDLVLAAVRFEQLPGLLPVLANSTGNCDVLIFTNTAGRSTAIAETLGPRCLLGFPSVGGFLSAGAVTYVLIRQQKTMLGEIGKASSARLDRLSTVFSGAGFATKTTARIDAWLLGHAAFVAPIAGALYRCDTDPRRLASDRQALKLMVEATREAFRALLGNQLVEIPANLKALYLRAPATFTVEYWRRTFAGPRGELWFAAHARAAREEMESVAAHLLDVVRATGNPADDLARLLSPPPRS